MIELMREYWDWFLFDTLAWTGGLIALVLLLRRPVARYLGSGAAYALWFLPLARLLFPPITLPAWMENNPPRVIEPPMDVAGPVAIADASPVFDSSMPEIAAPLPMESPLDLTLPLLVLWLAGAALFLGRRFWLYGQLRKELLADARPVGEIGRIRLIETPVIAGPMAFGVIDKVIALPEGFMTSHDRQARDLAIAHELAHHRGHDLLANILIQPLFAIHWFNPLGWVGWNAMRRDQEAACDARVVVSRPRDERAVYAAIIADFARRSGPAPRPALAAPMACPVLGDKSIIHRLKSLPMTDQSRRRRLAARGAVLAALLALPMTASVCYSSASAKPAFLGGEDADPQPMQDFDPDVAFDPDLDPEPLTEAEIERIEREAEEEFERAERDIELSERDIEKELAKIKVIVRDVESGDSRAIRKHKIEYNGKDWDTLSPAERKALERELKVTRRMLADGGEVRVELARARQQLADSGEMRRELRIAMAEAHEVRAEAMAEAREALAEARAEQMEALAEARSIRIAAPEVVMECRDEDQPVTSVTDRSGKTTLFVCESYGDRVALKSLKAARAAIAREKSVPADARAEALRELDEEIAEHSN